MDITEKMVSFQIIQNVLKVKCTLASGWLHEPCIDGLAPDKNEDAPAEVIRVAA